MTGWTWVLQNHHYRLSLIASRQQGSLLRVPTRVDIGGRVPETLNASVQVQLKTLRGKLLFEGYGTHAGLEVVGDLPKLLHSQSGLIGEILSKTGYFLSQQIENRLLRLTNALMSYYPLNHSNSSMDL